ncbi:calcium ion binding [Branchiostoma belcheri]|nr:calcium ion binding [Branchiostoma belcheri]
MQNIRQKIDDVDSILVDKCESQPCKNFGHCVNDPEMTYHCSCPRGRKGDHCEEDVNECAAPAPPCGGNSYCVNTEGSYLCTCMTGWTGPGESCLVDIDECETGQAACNSTHSRCHNLRGTYECVCPLGHQGPSCEPIPTTTAETTLQPTTTMPPPTTNALTSVGNSGTTVGNSGGSTAGNSGNSGRSIAEAKGGQGEATQNPLCGQTEFLAGSGYVTSPNYPNNYPNNIECTYRIAASPGMLVFIRFIDEFGLEGNQDGTCKYDYIRVVVNGTETLGTYCGTEGPPEGITGATVDVTLKTDFAIRRKGFRLRYEVVTEESLSTLPDTPSKCGGSVTTVSRVKGTLLSPMFPDNYPNDLSCSWTFLAPHDKYVSTVMWSRDSDVTYVEVRFESFSVETSSKCSYDRVEILIDGVETVEGPYCTSNPPGEAMYGRNITVKFITDATVAEQGFEMTYQSVDGVASLKKVITLADSLPCGETSYSNTGILESPNYPQKYTNDLHCAWVIRVTKGRTVKLWFATFDVEEQTYCQYDRVVVETHHRHYHQLCNSKQISPLESRTNQMKVTFITDAALAFTGFRAFWIAQHECKSSLLGEELLLQFYSVTRNPDTEKRVSRVVNVEEGKTGYLDCGDSNTMMGDPVVLTFGSPRYNWTHEGKPLAAEGTVLSVRGTHDSAGRYLCVASSNMTNEVLLQTFNVYVREAEWFGSGDEGSASGEGLGSGTDLSDQPAGELPETGHQTPAQTPKLWDGDSEISSSLTLGSGQGRDGVEDGVAPTDMAVTTGREGEGFESQSNGQQVQASSDVRSVLFGSENENEEVLAPTEEANGEGFESHGNENRNEGFSSVREEMFGRENENENPPAQPESADPLAGNVDVGIAEDTFTSDTDIAATDNDVDAFTVGEAPEVHPLMAVQAFVREVTHMRDSGELSPASLFRALGMSDRAFSAEQAEAFPGLLRGLGNLTATGLLQALGIGSEPFLEKSMEAFFSEMHRMRAAGNHTVSSLLKSLGVPLPEIGVESETDPMANLTRLFSDEIDPGAVLGEGGDAMSSFAKAFADIMEISKGWGKKKK